MHQPKRLYLALVVSTMLSGAGGLAFAQQTSPEPIPGMSGGDQRSMDHGGMMGGGSTMGGMGGAGMMGMMNMMQNCQRMIMSGATGSGMVPRMPPGNEKLQFQMRAEMMQKMGEIAAKYAERIKEEPGSVPR